MPTVTVFAVAPVPRFTAPLVPESSVRIPVVPVVMFKAVAVGDRMSPPVTVKSPVNVPFPDVSRDSAVVLLVIKLRMFASVEPIDTAVPNAFPPCSMAVLSTGKAVTRHVVDPESYCKLTTPLGKITPSAPFTVVI